MKEIQCATEVDALFGRGRTVVAFCPEWSMPAIICKKMLAEIEEEFEAHGGVESMSFLFLNDDNDENSITKAFVHYFDSGRDPDKRIAPSAIHGYGSVVWLYEGRVIGFVACAQKAGLDELRTQTKRLQLLCESSDSSFDLASSPPSKGERQ